MKLGFKLDNFFFNGACLSPNNFIPFIDFKLISLFFFVFFSLCDFGFDHQYPRPLHSSSEVDLRPGSSQGQTPGSLRNKLFSALGLHT